MTDTEQLVIARRALRDIYFLYENCQGAEDAITIATKALEEIGYQKALHEDAAHYYSTERRVDALEKRQEEYR